MCAGWRSAARRSWRSRHYGLSIQTCEPADPQSNGGSEAAVKIAKADLVPTDHNLREDSADWQALEQACREFMADVNTRPHRATLAIDKGRTVSWHTLDSLAALFRRHRADDSINKATSKLIRSDLILIDDVGLLPVSADAADALFRVVDAAYEKRSIAISSNIHPSGFDELMPKTMATATVDRLMHHAHILITDGQDSYRPPQATAGKGVKPLA